MPLPRRVFNPILSPMTEEDDIYTIDCPLGSGSAIVGGAQDEDGRLLDVGDVRSDPRWGKDLEWMENALMECFAASLGDGAVCVPARAAIGKQFVFVDVRVSGGTKMEEA
jgi:hypothetical protein